MVWNFKLIKLPLKNLSMPTIQAYIFSYICECKDHNYLIGYYHFFFKLVKPNKREFDKVFLVYVVSQWWKLVKIISTIHSILYKMFGTEICILCFFFLPIAPVGCLVWHVDLPSLLVVWANFIQNVSRLAHVAPQCSSWPKSLKFRVN